jgi:hypothetical protein
MECFGTTDFDNNSRLITLYAIIISGLHCITKITPGICYRKSKININIEMVGGGRNSVMQTVQNIVLFVLWGFFEPPPSLTPPQFRHCYSLIIIFTHCIKMDTLYRKVKTNLHHYKIQFLIFQGINDDVYFIIRHSRTEVGQENQFFLRKLLFPENDQNLVLFNRIHANEEVITWVQCKREYVNDKVLHPISSANRVCDR